MSDETIKTPDNTGEIQEKRDGKGRFIKGMSGNPEGKPIGSKNKNFSAYWNEAIKVIAEERGISENEAEVELLVVAYKAAKDGNYSYFREIMDRKHGKLKEESDVTVHLPIPILNVLRDNNSNKANNETNEED